MTSLLRTTFHPHPNLRQIHNTVCVRSSWFPIVSLASVCSRSVKNLRRIRAPAAILSTSASSLRQMLADTFYHSEISCSRVAPGNLEHAGPTGMVLASVLGIQFDTEPENELCVCVNSNIHWVLLPEPMATLVVVVLKFVAYTASPITVAMFSRWWTSKSTPKRVYSYP